MARGNQHAMRILFCIAAVVASASCSGDVESEGNTATGGAGATGGSGTGGAAAAPGGGGTTAGGGSAGVPSVVCAGVACAENEDCCLETGKCFDPAASPESCEVPKVPPGPQGQAPCGSSAHCAAGEFCSPANWQLCLGPGYCESKSNCGTSSGMLMCGCNGVTYPDVQTACAEGVHVIGSGKCGETQTLGAAGGSAGKTVTFCATSSMCPAGQECCSITGQCFDPAKPALCAFPPEGSKFPCIDDSQCFQGAEYCSGETCDGPGGCVNKGGTCTGELSPVCGCNGKTFVNAGCAAAEGVRVAHSGACK